MEPKFSQILPTEIKTQERVIYMALNKEVLVEMPVHCVRAKKDKAVYVLRSVRIGTKKGSRPVSVYRSVYVGKKKQIELPAFVRNCGTYASFSGISEILGLGKLLEKHFGQERAKEILTIAHYMCNSPFYFETRKNFSHSCKNMLTNIPSCGIIPKLSGRPLTRI